MPDNNQEGFLSRHRGAIGGLGAGGMVVVGLVAGVAAGTLVVGWPVWLAIGGLAVTAFGIGYLYDRSRNNAHVVNIERDGAEKREGRFKHGEKVANDERKRLEQEKKLLEKEKKALEKENTRLKEAFEGANSAYTNRFQITDAAAIATVAENADANLAATLDPTEQDYSQLATNVQTLFSSSDSDLDAPVSNHLPGTTVRRHKTAKK